jgi:transposase
LPGWRPSLLLDVVSLRPLVEDPNLVEYVRVVDGVPVVEGTVIGEDAGGGEDVESLASWRERAITAESRVAELSEHVAVLSRILFGQSSERGPATRSSDTDTPNGAGEPSPASGPAGATSQTGRGQRRGSAGHGRRDYAHLQTREEVHDVPLAQRCCTACGRAFAALGSETSERIDWDVSITRVVHRRLRYRRACACPGPKTITAPPAREPVPKGMFTAGFLARLLYDKYVRGLPVQRIVRGLAAEGFDVAEGTLCGALKSVAALLEPVEAAIVARNATATHAHADETTWRVFAEVEGKTGSRWWLWVFLADDTVVFAMDPTRSATVLDRHFGIDRTEGTLAEGRRLVLSTDFYTAYQSLARVEGVDPLWCFAHIRRYFIRAGDAHVQLRIWRDQWVARIGALYLAHKAMAATDPGTPAYTQAATDFDQALQVIDTTRQEQAQIYSLHPAAKKVLATLDREWEGLARHRDFPDIDLDNNVAERALRTPVVGRKNYYGSNAEWAAHLAARVWTITATAERNGREPLAHLTEILTACGDTAGVPLHGPAFERLLPWNRDPAGPGSRDHDPPQLINPAPIELINQGP